MYKNSSFNLQTSDGALKLYSRECLSPAFIKNLYSSTISNMLDSYGDFVLTGYVTGGKALALYAGETKDGIASVHKEEKMNNSIDATFSWKRHLPIPLVEVLNLEKVILVQIPLHLV